MVMVLEKNNENYILKEAYISIKYLITYGDESIDILNTFVNSINVMTIFLESFIKETFNFYGEKCLNCKKLISDINKKFVPKILHIKQHQDYIYDFNKKTMKLYPNSFLINIDEKLRVLDKWKRNFRPINELIKDLGAEIKNPLKNINDIFNFWIVTHLIMYYE